MKAEVVSSLRALYTLGLYRPRVYGDVMRKAMEAPSTAKAVEILREKKVSLSFLREELDSACRDVATVFATFELASKQPPEEMERLACVLEKLDRRFVEFLHYREKPMEPHEFIATVATMETVIAQKFPALLNKCSVILDRYAHWEARFIQRSRYRYASFFDLVDDGHTLGNFVSKQARYMPSGKYYVRIFRDGTELGVLALKVERGIPVPKTFLPPEVLSQRQRAKVLKFSIFKDNPPSPSR